MGELAEDGGKQSRRSRWTQQEILDSLQQKFDRFARWHGTNPFEMVPEQRAEFDTDYEEMERAVIRARKAGITSPMVENWIAARRGFADYDWLRKLRQAMKQALPARSMKPIRGLRYMLSH